MTLRTVLFGTLVAALCHTAVLAKIIYDRSEALRTGTEVLLQSGFVDPRDLFRGHYTRLNLEISRVARQDVEIVGQIFYGNPVFVELTATDGFATVSKIHGQYPANPDGPVLKGTSRFQSTSTDDSLRIDFPFDRFFAAKDRALELENMQQKQQLGVILSVAPDGSALIKGLTLKGAKVYEEPLF